jgi:rfaE bifunctional protein kinase chain/domain
MDELNNAAKKALDLIKRRQGEVNILVVGDLMLDSFLYGSVDRISPEAPVPVVDVNKETIRPGGAANVILNLLSMGANAMLCGVIGSDYTGEKLRTLLGDAGCELDGLVLDHKRPTAIKTRVIAQHQQVVRFDREDKKELSKEISDELIGRIREMALKSDAVIVSDYGKVVIGSGVMEALLAAGKIIAIDPKPVNFNHYKGATVLTPNAKETYEMCGILPDTDEAALEAGNKLMNELGANSMLITRGEKGMTLVEKGKEPTHIPTSAKDVFDVTGAGDTSISLYTLALASGASPVEAAALANFSGSIVVGKLGTATVTMSELRAVLN